MPVHVAKMIGSQARVIRPRSIEPNGDELYPQYQQIWVIAEETGGALQGYAQVVTRWYGEGAKTLSVERDGKMIQCFRFAVGEEFCIVEMAKGKFSVKKVVLLPMQSGYILKQTFRIEPTKFSEEAISALSPKKAVYEPAIRVAIQRMGGNFKEVLYSTGGRSDEVVLCPARVAKLSDRGSIYIPPERKEARSGTEQQRFLSKEPVWAVAEEEGSREQGFARVVCRPDGSKAEYLELNRAAERQEIWAVNFWFEIGEPFVIIEVTSEGLFSIFESKLLKGGPKNEYFLKSRIIAAEKSIRFAAGPSSFSIYLDALSAAINRLGCSCCKHIHYGK